MRLFLLMKKTIITIKKELEEIAGCHIILTAEMETVIERINSNPTTRDKSLAIDNLKQNTKYLQDNYQDAEWVTTDGKTPLDVADCVVHIINQHMGRSRSVSSKDYPDHKAFR